MVSLQEIGALVLYLGASLAFFTGLSAIERGMDAVRWPRNIVKSAAVNIGFMFFNILLAPTTYFVATNAQSAYERLDIPHVPAEFWDGLPLWVAGAGWIVLHDFYVYWVHRLLHSRLLWPIHSIHHSDPDLNNTTAFRNHFIEPWAMAISAVLFTSWAGLSPAVIAVASFLVTIYDRYIHLRVDWTHGVFRFVFVSPRFHQWHHADDPEAYNTNFSNLISGWDVLFGTYRVPGKCNESFGVSGMPRHNFFKLLIWPFLRWKAMCSPGHGMDTVNKKNTAL